MCDLQVFPSCLVLLLSHIPVQNPCSLAALRAPLPMLGQPQLAENCHPAAGVWLCSQHLLQCSRELPEALQRGVEKSRGHIWLAPAPCPGFCLLWLTGAFRAGSGGSEWGWLCLAGSPVCQTGSVVRGRCHDKLYLSRLLLGSAAPRCITVMRYIKGEGS